MNWKRGDILRGRKGSDAIHPIIFWRGQDDTFFIGAMITHLDRNNIFMSEEHFYKQDERGNKYELFFDKSYLVEALLLKRLEWRPFRKIGQLTDPGIIFVDSKIGDSIALVWEEYLEQGGI